MDRRLVWSAFRELVPQMANAIAAWGFGIILMLSYCWLTWYLLANYGIPIMMVGSICALMLMYFVIDWSYTYQEKLQAQQMRRKTSIQARGSTLDR